MKINTTCETIKKDILELLSENIKIDKPIRLIEFFAGYGSQALALKYLNVPFESWKICEWAVNSIQAYKDLHFSHDNNDYVDNNMDQEQVLNYLFKMGISSDNNKPMTLDQIKRKGFNWQKQVLNNIIATHNIVNIQRARAKHLNIVDADKYTYILTYSFPCQDLSLCGKQKGMSDTSTRSGMLWEVERILKELDSQGIHIPILLMENVPQIHSKTNNIDFLKWQNSLKDMGYKNYYQDLNAKDYGIPQNRNRCFMISIYGDYKYTFPQKQQLQLRLKDMLEDNVDESYYLSEEKIKAISNWKAQQKPLKNINEEKIISPTLTARGAGEEHSGMVLINEKVMRIGNYSPSGHNASSIVSVGGLAPTVMENHGTITAIMENIPNVENIKNSILESIEGVIIPEATKKGYAIAHEGDGVYTNRPHQKRGVVQNQMIQTIKTSVDDIGVVVKKDTDNYIEWQEKGKFDIDCRAFYENKIAPTTTTTPKTKVIQSDLRIRKLTPRECGRLMGVSDSDITIMSKNQSNSSLYHLFGDSIVVNVLIEIFKVMLLP